MTAPTLIAYEYCPLLYCDAQAVVWCVHCKRWHWHVVGDEERHGALRFHHANCNADGGSPYLDTGYRLAVRPMSEAIRRDVSRTPSTTRGAAARGGVA